MGDHQNLILMSHFAVEDGKIETRLKTMSCFKLHYHGIKDNLECQESRRYNMSSIRYTTIKLPQESRGKKLLQ